MDLKIVRITVEDWKDEDYPWPVVHNVVWLDPEWPRMVYWTNENIGPQGKLWIWRVSTTWRFANYDDAVNFALNWT